jgi:hypothetical protein
MKTISLIAAGVLALGWGTARAETQPSSNTTDPTYDGTTPPPMTNVEVSPAPPVAPGDETTTGPTTNIEVDTPPGSDVDVNINQNPPAVAPAPVQMQPARDSERGRISRTGRRERCA